MCYCAVNARPPFAPSQTSMLSGLCRSCKGLECLESEAMTGAVCGHWYCVCGADVRMCTGTGMKDSRQKGKWGNECRNPLPWNTHDDPWARGMIYGT